MLDERHQEHIGDRRAPRGALIAGCQPGILGIVDQQRHAFFRHISYVAFAGILGGPYFDGCILSGCGDQAQPAAIEHP